MAEQRATPLHPGEPQRPVRPGLGWLVMWMAAAVTTAVGTLFLYLGPTGRSIGKGFVHAPLLGQAPLALIGIGGLGIAAGTYGIALSVLTADDQSAARRTLGVRTTGLADAAVYISVVLASGALAAVTLIEFAWPTIAIVVGAGPCESASVACFSAHPDFYQESPPGSGGYTTPASRFYQEILSPAFVAVWPLALSAALTSVIALALGARRRGVALLGVTLGSITVVWMAAMQLWFAVVGGD